MHPQKRTMDRAEFIGFLSRSEADGFLQPDDADALLASFERGEVVEGSVSLPLSEAIPTEAELVTEEKIEAEVLYLQERLKTQKPAELREALQDEYEAACGEVAGLAASGNVREWQRRQGELMDAHTLRQALLGELAG